MQNVVLHQLKAKIEVCKEQAWVLSLLLLHLRASQLEMQPGMTAEPSHALSKLNPLTPPVVCPSGPLTACSGCTGRSVSAYHTCPGLSAPRGRHWSGARRQGSLGTAQGAQ